MHFLAEEEIYKKITIHIGALYYNQLQTKKDRPYFYIYLFFELLKQEERVGGREKNNIVRLFSVPSLKKNLNKNDKDK